MQNPICIVANGLDGTVVALRLLAMTVRPARSPGVLVASLADRAVAFDLATERVHHLNAAAGAALTACNGTTPDTDLDSVLAAASAEMPDAARVAMAHNKINTIVAAFTDAGLVDRAEPFTPPQPLAEPSGPSVDDQDAHHNTVPDPSTAPATPSSPKERTMMVLDRTVTLRGPVALVDQVISHIGLAPARVRRWPAARPL